MNNKAETFEIQRKMKRIKSICRSVITIVVFFLFSCSQPDPAISQIEAFIAESKVEHTKEGWKQNGLPKPPQLTFDPASRYLWNLTTNLGEMTIELKAAESPYHVSSTIYLTTLGFYDNLIFHRIIPGFMAQGGDPIGVGVGGPGYYYMGEFDSDLKHDKPGILSMANSGANTDGSQFFLTFKATPHLNGRHTVFGELIAGIETLKLIEQQGTRPGKPKSNVKIIKATIQVKPVDD